MNPIDDEPTRRLDDKPEPFDSEAKTSDARKPPGISPSENLGFRGKTLGHYRLITEIGHGGQGFVYLAEDLKIHRQVALKILLRGHALSAALRLRFEREAEIAGKLDHPGISRIYESGEQDGILFIAMELVRGKTLSKHISETATGATNRVPSSELQGDVKDRTKASFSSSSAPMQADHETILSSVRFIESAATALHAAHEAGLLHRDIKPGNLMIREDDSACILDFGLALDEEAQGMTLTQTGDLMGTPAYMSPEQLLAHRVKLDRRTDVYSLGVCLFEACTLERPFRAKSSQELYEAISQREPTPPRRINQRIPKDLEAIILTAMDKDRNRRYPTALALAEDLRRFRNLEPVEARPAGPVVKTLRWVQRNPIVATACAAVFIALLAAASVFYVKGDEARSARDRAQEAQERAEREAQEKGMALAAETRERQAKEMALADKVAALAEKSAALMDREQTLADYQRLADVKRLESAIRDSELLYPVGPDLIDKLEDWQRVWNPLIGRLESHELFLAELRRKSPPYTEEDRLADFAPEIAEMKKAQKELTAIEQIKSATAEGTAKFEFLRDRENTVKGRIAEIESCVHNGRRTARLDDQNLQFQHDVISTLVTDLETFMTSETGPVKSIAKRLSQSRTIAAETLEGDVAALWSSCAARIAENSSYSDLALKPQLGLIPLGTDPDSGLEEFLHWLTHIGPVPARTAQGKIAVTEELGLVLVLVPGGTFRMGSQRDDPGKPNYDPYSLAQEQPVHEIELSPYLLSKYEMTQAQWRRAFNTTPSQYSPGTGLGDPRFKAMLTASNPVEQVSWADAQLLLPRLDLGLPTEAEWECAARGGRTDQIWVGTSDPSELNRFANLCGDETRALGFVGQQQDFADDFVLHAPVGSFAANTYGFHDMSGNVQEWCLDGAIANYAETPGPRGVRGESESNPNHVTRSGCFIHAANSARSASRSGNSASTRFNTIGIRPYKTIR